MRRRRSGKLDVGRRRRIKSGTSTPTDAMTVNVIMVATALDHPDQSTRTIATATDADRRSETRTVTGAGAARPDAIAGITAITIVGVETKVPDGDATTVPDEMDIAASAHAGTTTVSLHLVTTLDTMIVSHLPATIPMATAMVTRQVRTTVNPTSPVRPHSTWQIDPHQQLVHLAPRLHPLPPAMAMSAR